jgi:hypothetical protein
MMTDKIEELAEEAGFMDGWFSESGDDCKTEIKKFAELIIQECIKRIEGTTAPEVENMDSAQNYGYAQWWEGYDDRGVDSIESIIMHFGINNETN